MSKEEMTPKQWKDAQKIIEKMKPPVIERRESCPHMELKKLVKESFTYQCQNPECQEIFLIVGAASYRPDQYVKETMMVNKYLLAQDPELLAKMEAIINPQKEEKP